MTNPMKTKVSKKSVYQCMGSAILAIALTAGFSQQAHADWDHGHGHGHDHDHDHGHFHGYNDHDWHRGHWYHGVHEGRPGWWWTVDDVWYAYPEPVYPYPVNPYAAPVYYSPPPVVVAPPPPEPGFNLVVPIHIH